MPEEPPQFVCPQCGMESWNPNDRINGYCGNCHEYTGHEGTEGILTQDQRMAVITRLKYPWRKAAMLVVDEKREVWLIWMKPAQREFIGWMRDDLVEIGNPPGFVRPDGTWEPKA